MKRKLKPLEYAFWLLKLRDRSVGEMEEKLRRREYPADEISQTLQFLIDLISKQKMGFGLDSRLIF